MIRKSVPVPIVDPHHLRQALDMICEWASDDAAAAEPMATLDLHELLDRIASTLSVESDMAIALFKRAIALSAFCTRETLADDLFDEGVPGRALFAAAAKTPVLDVPGRDEGEMSHTLDAATMHQALIDSGN